MSVRFIALREERDDWGAGEPDGGVYGVFSGDGVGAPGGEAAVCRSVCGAICWGFIAEGGSRFEMEFACLDRQLVCGLATARGTDFGNRTDKDD
jgi:hypothetical protein